MLSNLGNYALQFELVYKNAEEIENICCVWKVTVQLITETRWFMKILVGLQELQQLGRSGKPKSVDSEAVLQAIEINLGSSIWRTSISHSPVRFVTFMTLANGIWSCWIVPHITKILQNFWLTLVYSILKEWNIFVSYL